MDNERWQYEARRAELAGQRAYLPTTPGTQVTLEGRWCARHTPPAGLRWAHRLAHRLGILRRSDPRALERIRHIGPAGGDAPPDG